MSDFWKNYWIGYCVAIGLFGVILAGAGLEATSGPTRILFEQLNGPGEFELDPHLRFSTSLLGAVTLGWSITLLAAVLAAIQLGPAGRPIWLLLTASLLTWYIVDSSLSVYTGFWRNTIPNTVFLVAFLIPLVRSGVLSGRS